MLGQLVEWISQGLSGALIIREKEMLGSTFEWGPHRSTSPVSTAPSFEDVRPKGSPGRKSVGCTKVAHERSLMSKWAQAREWVDDSVPKAEIARRLKVGRTTLYAYFKAAMD